MKLIVYGMVTSLFLSACQGEGPRTSAILDSPNAVKVSAEYNDPFVLIETNIAVAMQVAASGAGSNLTNFVTDHTQEPVVIGSGDILDISIVSTSTNGFVDFAQSSIAPLSTTSLPSQEVGSDGNVNVPPIGRVKASGRSVQGFETFLTERLGEILVEPSVIVNLADRRSARVAVLGRVGAPGPYSINQDSRHLVDIISAAGGPSARAEELRVRLSRGGREGIVSMDQLLTVPLYNVHVKAGDVVYVETTNNRYTLLGAGGVNAAFDFDEPTLNLSDALARAGGLSRGVAERKGVFLFREVPRTVVQALGADVGQFTGPVVPTVFQFDLSKPTTIFTLSKFEMVDGDIVYISKDLIEEIAVVMGAIRPFVPAPVEFIRSEVLQ